MIINSFNIFDENSENNINNPYNIDELNCLNNNAQLNSKFDTILDGILLEINKKDDLN